MKSSRYLTGRMLLTGALLAVGLTACVNLKPAEDTTRFYVLTASRPASETAAPSGAPRILLGRVEVADYLRAPQLAFRAAPNRIGYADLHQWAEPLDAALPRILEQDFLLRLGSGNAALPDGPTREVRFSFLRFDLTPNGETRTEVICRVIDPASRQVLVERTLLRETAATAGVTGFDEAVASLSGQLGELADEAIALARAARP
ncbi:MAG: membrane integrity-associated transporter subunit PqiC [Verrucomicrobiae bacterium]|nr:membrane integrity-associated transporter subunit PqiC [Verrucomicrobiae bacterium]